MHTRLPILRSGWEAPFLSVLLMLIGGAMILVGAVGCQSAESSTPTQASAKPNFGPPMQDVRTEANIAGMENDYNAEKNSQPTHHAEAQAEAAKKAQEKQDQEKAAAEAQKNSPDPAK